MATTSWQVRMCPPVGVAHSQQVYHQYIVSGYSAEVDLLRERMKENEKQVNKLANSIR